MLDICQPPCTWETGGAYSYGGTAAIWKRPIRYHQPSEPAALRLLEASEAALRLLEASEAAGSHNYVIHRPLPRVYEYTPWIQEIYAGRRL